MAEQPTFIAINTPPSIREKRRVLKSGRQQRRFSIEVKAEPILHVFDEREMGRAPAEAMTRIVGERLEKNERRVSTGTTIARIAAERAFQAGKRWAVKRYSGGRTGPTPPNPDSTTYGVDSGRLAHNLFARFDRSISGWNVFPPANRLTVDTFDGPGFEAWLAEFAKIVDIKTVVATKEFQDAQREAMGNAIKVARGRMNAAQAKLMRQLLGSFRVAQGAVTALL